MIPLKLRWAGAVTFLVLILGVGILGGAACQPTRCMLKPIDRKPLHEFDAPVAIEELEIALASIEVDGTGKPVIRLPTESVLGRAAAAIPEEFSQADTTSLAELIQRSFPDRDSRAVFELLERYRDYAIARQGENEDDDEQRSPAEALEHDKRKFIELQSLQTRYLGESLKNSLYGTQNAIALAMLSLREVELDSSLSEDEKAKKMTQIQARLEQFMENSSDVE